MSARAVRSIVAWCALVATGAPLSTVVASIACHKPADIVHGSWSWVNNTTVAYSCQLGSLLGGPVTRTCKSGKWYPTYPPQCTVVCQRPPVDSNADMSVLAWEKTYFTSGETVKFTCHDRNEYTLLCDRGRWRTIGRFRRCKDSQDEFNASLLRYLEWLLGFGKRRNSLEVNCGTLTVANAVCTQEKVAKCSCNDGYVLVGSPNVTCQANGRWSDNHPECKPRACKELPHVHGSQKEGDGGTVGNTVHFKCNEGFRLEGESTLTCLETKEWSSPPPACSPFCGKPPPQRHAQLATAYDRRGLYRVDQYAYFYCDEYYRSPSLGFYLTCKQEGERTTWDTDHRRCNREECERPDKIPNGNWEGNVTIGSSITYSCDEHFRLGGESTLTCLETKEWSSPPPVCDPFCGKPPPQRHAQLAAAYDRRGLYRVDQYAYFYCDEYYRSPSLGFYLTCKQEGGRTTWDTDHRRCNREECERPDEIPNGKWEGNATTGSSITYSCDEHFTLQGNRTLVCLYNKRWLSSPPACKPFCGKPPPQPHAKLSSAYAHKQQYLENQTVYFDCDEDYKSPSDGFDLYCRRKGDLTAWDTDHKRCNPSTCGTPPDQPHAKVKIPTGHVRGRRYDVHEYVYVDCDDRFKSLAHGYYMFCKKDGSGAAGWVVDSFLGCTPELCYAPGEVEHGFWTGNITVGSSIEFSCQKHFTLRGASRLTCDSTTKKWSSTAPRCEQTANATQSSNHGVGETPRQGGPAGGPTQNTSSPTHEASSTAQVHLPWGKTVSPNQPRPTNQSLPSNQPRPANQPMPANQSLTSN